MTLKTKKKTAPRIERSGRKRKVVAVSTARKNGKAVNVYKLECGHRVHVTAAIDKGRDTHNHFVCKACHPPLFKLSSHGPRRRIVKTAHEIFDGLRLNVYTLVCGHVVRLRSVYDTSKGRAKSRLCGECLTDAKKVARRRSA